MKKSPSPKDTVYVLSLKRYGTVVRKTSQGKFDVQIGAYVFQCMARDLELRDDLKQSPKNPKPDFKRTIERTRPIPSIDLHGLTVDEALRRVDRALNQAMFSGQDRLEIVHGVGTGKLRTALHKYLARIPTVEFQMDSGNIGATWVYFP